MEKILVAIDLDKGAESVMQTTRKYARVLDASVVLVNLEPLLPGAEGSSSEDVTRDIVQGYGEEIRTVHDLGEELTAEGIDNRVLIIEGTAADEMLAEAERESPTLIIIASERHGGLVEALTHGLREQLARQVRCPVLLVPVD